MHDIAVGPSGDSSNSDQAGVSSQSVSSSENTSQSGNNEFVYVTDNEIFNVQKFTTDGDCITSWGSEGDGDGQFNQPEGIDVDLAGRVIVADTGNNRIVVSLGQGKVFKVVPSS